MKKELNKILIVLGFVVAVIGGCLALVVVKTPLLLDINVYTTLAAVLAVTFIYANNSIIKNIGYILSTLSVVTALHGIISEAAFDNVGLLVYDIGLIIMAVGALIYFLIIFLTFCGFVKGGKQPSNASRKSNLLDELIRYKEMQQEKVLTEEEFGELKQKILESCDNKNDSIDDLKKWKKLVDQQVITEEEFSKIKADIFCK